MRDKEKSIEFTMRFCQHYDGLKLMQRDGQCNAGVIYDKTFGKEPGIVNRMPCTKGNDRSHEEQISACPKWLRSTREQGEQRFEEMEASMAKMKIVMAAISEWRKTPPKGKQAVIECPICKGKLHLSQSSYNGHVHGNCETKDCVSWME